MEGCLPLQYLTQDTPPTPVEHEPTREELLIENAKLKETIAKIEAQMKALLDVIRGTAS